VYNHVDARRAGVQSRRCAGARCAGVQSRRCAGARCAGVQERRCADKHADNCAGMQVCRRYNVSREYQVHEDSTRTRLLYALLQLSYPLEFNMGKISTLHVIIP
jgi:hypothetical protein